jgi:hypothetical protein
MSLGTKFYRVGSLHPPRDTKKRNVLRKRRTIYVDTVEIIDRSLRETCIAVKVFCMKLFVYLAVQLDCVNQFLSIDTFCAGCCCT